MIGWLHPLAILILTSLMSADAPPPIQHPAQSIQLSDNTAPPATTNKQQMALPPAKTGTDDDSVRPVNPALRPQTITPLPKVQRPTKSRIGTDDDSVRPMPLQPAPSL